MDLSNARIIEWDYDGETLTAVRKARGEPFQYIFCDGIYTAGEEEARDHRMSPIRVVAEFPAPSLAEIVGDAPAFRATYQRNQAREECLVVRVGGGAWLGLSLEAAGARHLFLTERLSDVEGDIDVASVVPFVAREVVS